VDANIDRWLFVDVDDRKDDDDDDDGNRRWLTRERAMRDMLVSL